MTSPRALRTLTQQVAAFVATLSFVAHAGVTQTRVVTWKATEVWRVDGTEAGEPFSRIGNYVVLPDGTLWVLDFKDQIIRRYSAAGKPLPVVGRRGSGPGEFQNATGMTIASGGTVWVNDPGNARFSIFNPDGSYRRDVLADRSSYSFHWNAWYDASKNEVVEQQANDTHGWTRFASDGKIAGTLQPVRCGALSNDVPFVRAATPGSGSMNASYPFMLGGGSVADGRGNVWCASVRGTTVALVRPGSTDTIVATVMPIPNIPVSNAERAAAIDRLQKMLARYATSDFAMSKVPREKPGIAALNVDDDGRLWVQHGDAFNVKSTVLDVFDIKGQLLGRVTLPFSHPADLPIRARGNDLWLTVVDADDVPSMVRYKLQIQ